MDKKLDLILKELQNMNERIAKIEEVTSIIPEIKAAVLETDETVKRIEATQEKHERTLDLLSRRSIDQEAELKRIK